MVKIYTKSNCPYCDAAKSLLRDRGVAYEEIKLSPADADAWNALIAKSKMRTVPQIFHGEELIGGFDQLSALDRLRGLDHLK